MSAFAIEAPAGEAESPSIFGSPSLVDSPEPLGFESGGIFSAPREDVSEGESRREDDNPPAPIRLVDTPREPEPAAPDPVKTEVAPDDFEAAFEKLVPSAPDFLKNQEEINGWGKMKGTLKSTIAENRALQMQIADLSKGGAAPGGELPPERIEQIRAEARLEVEGKAREAQARAEAAEARLGLLGLKQFRDTFDAPRAKIMDEVQEIAKEAGLDLEAVKGYLKAPSKYAAEKILDDLTDDRTAIRLLGERRSDFQRLTDERQAEMESENPLAVAEKWKTEEKAAQARLAGTMFTTMRTQFEAALPDVAAAVKEFDGPLGAFFASSNGATALNELAEGISKNEVWDPKTMLTWAAKAKAADAISAFAARQQQTIQDQKAQLARLSRAQPGTPDGRQTQGGKPSIFTDMPRTGLAF